MPSELVKSESIWRWLLPNLLILGIYAAAFVFAGSSLPTPSWANSSDKLTIIGWLFHLLGAIFFLGTLLALLIRKGPFFPKILIGYLLSLLLFVIGSVLHTAHLGVSAEYADLRRANPNATISDVTDATISISDAIRAGGGDASLSILLQWVAAIVFYLYMVVLVYRAPSSQSRLASASAQAKHKSLMELKELATFHRQLTAQMQGEQQADDQAKVETNGQAGLLTARTRGESRGGQQQTQQSNGPDILTLDSRGTTAAGSRPATGRVADSFAFQAQSSLLTEEEFAQREQARMVQEELDREARDANR